MNLLTLQQGMEQWQAGDQPLQLVKAGQVVIFRVRAQLAGQPISVLPERIVHASTAAGDLRSGFNSQQGGDIVGWLEYGSFSFELNQRYRRHATQSGFSLGEPEPRANSGNRSWICSGNVVRRKFIASGKRLVTAVVSPVVQRRVSRHGQVNAGRIAFRLLEVEL